jgi:hypothetical protein
MGDSLFGGRATRISCEKSTDASAAWARELIRRRALRSAKDRPVDVFIFAVDRPHADDVALVGPIRGVNAFDDLDAAMSPMFHASFTVLTQACARFLRARQNAAFQSKST